MFRRIICALLALMLGLFALCSCSDKEDTDIPDGMKLIESEFTDFLFFVPEDWYISSSTGFLQAYDESDKSNFSLQAMSLGVNDYLSILDFWQRDYKTKVEGTLRNVVYDGESGAGETVSMGGREALRVVYTADFDGDSYKFMQVIAVVSNTAYIFTYTARADIYDTHVEDAVKAVSEFKFK